MDPDLKVAAERLLGHEFARTEHLEAAVTHASLVDSRLQSNERLEFLGDAVLGLIVCEYLHDTYSDLLEGDLTKLKSVAVSRRTCARIAQDLGLDMLLRTGKGMSGRQRLPASLAAAVYESLIAALYMDAGYEKTRDFVLEGMVPIIESAVRNGHQHNFKSILQQCAQRDFGVSATYVLLDEEGPDHAKAFRVAVVIGGRRFRSEWATSKKLAEQRAARNALLELGVVRVATDPGDEIYVVDEDVLTGRTSIPELDGTHGDPVPALDPTPSSVDAADSADPVPAG